MTERKRRGPSPTLSSGDPKMAITNSSPSCAACSACQSLAISVAARPASAFSDFPRSSKSSPLFLTVCNCGMWQLQLKAKAVKQVANAVEKQAHISGVSFLPKPPCKDVGVSVQSYEAVVPSAAFPTHPSPMTSQVLCDTSQELLKVYISHFIH